MIGGKRVVPAPKLLTPDDLERIEGDLKARTLKIDGAWALFHHLIMLLQIQGILMEELVKATGQSREDARKWLFGLYKAKLKQYNEQMKLLSDSDSPKGS